MFTLLAMFLNDKMGNEFFFILLIDIAIVGILLRHVGVL